MAGAAGDVGATQGVARQKPAQNQHSRRGGFRHGGLDSQQREKTRYYDRDQSFGEPVTQPNFQEISLKLKVSGSLQAVIRWLVELQQPANFQAIPALSMKSDTDPSKIICELTVARCFRP